MISDSIREFNYADKADELLISQYYNSENLKNYIKAFTSPIQPIMEANADSIDSRDIDSATGFSLDKIATTVGESRVIRGAAALGYFGFKQEPSAEGLDVGVFYSYGDTVTGDLYLTDAYLRRVIRARIILNTQAGTIEKLIKYHQLLVGRDVSIELTEGTMASVALNFHEDLSAQDKTILSVKYAKPVGVSITMRDNNGNIDLRT